jgi:glycosyltransferase involved in cell wall biosynthesis
VSDQPAEQLPSVSVVIPTRNGAARLEACLEVLRGVEPIVEIVVVVDGPDPEAERVLERCRAFDPRVVTIVVPPGGPAAARVVAVRNASGDVLLFLDDDIVASPGFVEGHARHHAQAAKVVVVGYTPVVAGPDQRRPTVAERLYAEEYERMCAHYELKPEEVLLSMWGGFSVRRSDCVDIGLASPDFALRYHEDREFGLRCHKAGLVGVFDRGLYAEHRYSTDDASFSADAREQGAGRLLVHRLHEDAIGRLDVDSFSEGLPPLAGTLVRLTRGSRSHAVAVRVLGGALGAARLLRLSRVELLLARFLRRIEQQHGALELERRMAKRGTDTGDGDHVHRARASAQA